MTQPYNKLNSSFCGVHHTKKLIDKAPCNTLLSDAALDYNDQSTPESKILMFMINYP